jgi:hypothetical protein
VQEDSVAALIDIFPGASIDDSYSISNVQERCSVVFDRFYSADFDVIVQRGFLISKDRWVLD